MEASMARVILRKLTDVEAAAVENLVHRKREAELRCVHGESIATMARQDLTSIEIALRGLSAVMHGSHSDTLGLDLETHELYEDVEEDPNAALVEAIQANLDKNAREDEG